MSPSTPERIGLVTLALASVAVLVTQIWRLRFFTDDAFISFRYARNLLEGHGLVFNPGEWVEGYTNFLWVLEMALFWAVGIGPEAASWGLSILLTAVTVAVAAQWAWRAGGGWWVAAVALAILATERSLAVWATGGLETRQFTALAVSAWFAWTQPGRTAAITGSVLWGLAGLTRPEAYLLAPLSGILTLFDRFRAGDGSVRTVASLVAPGASMLALHLAFRLWAYGYPLPNTYYAKNVGPWVEMGASYLLVATVESGLWLLVPLAIVGAVARVRTTGRLAEAAGVICILAYVPFLVRIGGDHFEWRPLDWWWAPLAIGGAHGLVAIADRLGRRWLALVGLALVLVYGRAVQIGHEWQVHQDLAAERYPENSVPLRPRFHGMLWSLPGMRRVLPRYNRLHTWVVEHGTVRHHRHRRYTEKRLRLWSAYLPARDRIRLPEGLAVGQPSVGIVPFVLPNIRIVDTMGLTDPVVARNPVDPERERFLAHDRRPPPGYLSSRQAFLVMRPPEPSVEAALAVERYAWRIEPGLVMPLRIRETAPERVISRFPPEALDWRRIHPRHPEQNVLRLAGRRYQGIKFVGRFEEDFEDWTVDGELAAAPPRHLRVGGQGRVAGFVGTSMVNTFDAESGDGPTGSVRSPGVRIPPDALLCFLVGGGSEDVGVAVLVDGEPVHVAHGWKTETLHYEFVDLDEHEGGMLTIEIFDRAPGTAWGHVLADHFVLMQSDQ